MIIDSVRIMQVDTETSITLECGINDDYLINFIEWRKDKTPIGYSKTSNIIMNMFRGCSNYIIH